VDAARWISCCHFLQLPSNKAMLHSAASSIILYTQYTNTFCFIGQAHNITPATSIQVKTSLSSNMQHKQGLRMLQDWLAIISHSALKAHVGSGDCGGVLRGGGVPACAGSCCCWSSGSLSEPCP
jgi:hypothetical protein